jgi:hypothetical protein
MSIVMETIDTAGILAQFEIEGKVKEVKPLGNGLINDTYHVVTEGNSPDYVLQRINNAIFQDVDLLQHNIEVVTPISATSWKPAVPMTSTVKCCNSSRLTMARPIIATRPTATGA